MASGAVQRRHDLGHAKILLRLQSVSGVIAPARPVQPKEAGQPVRTDFALQHFEGIALELIVGHVFDGRHASCSRNHSTGFTTRTRGEPTRRAALLMNRSSVARRTLASPASVLLN